MIEQKILLTSVYGPYGVKNGYAEGIGMQMELFNNQITREQGLHSLRQSYWSFGLYLIAENISVPSTVLDFPTWKDFTEELGNGYTHVGISFIVPNVQKAKRMAQYIRKNQPELKIILGGYGTVIPEIDTIVPCDAVCRGEGVRWMRTYFGDDPQADLRHPVLNNPAYEYIYGYDTKRTASVILPGLGCVNGCDFCITSHNFKNQYVSLIHSGKEIFNVCRQIEHALRCHVFMIMDENFLKNPESARELLAEMEANRKLYVFEIFSSAEVIEKLGVDFLVRLGVRMVWIGVESRNMMYSKTSGLDIHEIVRKLRAKGIVVITSIILFLDHHDHDGIKEEIDWAISLNSDMTQFMQYTPYPSTKLFKRLSAQGRLKDIDYRKHHGQDELIFEHEFIKEPAEHYEYTRNAFRKKYLMDGPATANMALTLIQGYRTAEADLVFRKKEGLSWNPETLRYEKSVNPASDRFMLNRTRAKRMMAQLFRPFLLPALLFAPNRRTRSQVRKIMSMYAETFGKPTRKTRIASLRVLFSASIEGLRILLNRIICGNADFIRQPPTKRTEFPGMRNIEIKSIERENLIKERVPSVIAGS